MSSVSYAERIPHNVDPGGDRRLRRALESWLPNYLDRWRELGPAGAQAHEVHLRTAVDVGADGWARFGYVRMPEYRWGIFLADPVPDRRIAFGDRKGAPVWREVPGEHRAIGRFAGLRVSPDGRGRARRRGRGGRRTGHRRRTTPCSSGRR